MKDLGQASQWKKHHWMKLNLTIYMMMKLIIILLIQNPLAVELPNQVTCTVETTDVALKGQTVSSSYKPATLDNGINIQVPPFIDSGDKIIVDTRTMEYIKKI